MYNPQEQKRVEYKPSEQNLSRKLSEGQKEGDKRYPYLKKYADDLRKKIPQEEQYKIVNMRLSGTKFKDIYNYVSNRFSPNKKAEIDPSVSVVVNDILNGYIPKDKREEIAKRNIKRSGKKAYSVGIGKKIKENPSYLKTPEIIEKRKVSKIFNNLDGMSNIGLAASLYLTEDGENPVSSKEIAYILSTHSKQQFYNYLKKAKLFGLVSKEEQEKEKKKRKEYFNYQLRRKFGDLEETIVGLANNPEYIRAKGIKKGYLDITKIQTNLEENGYTLNKRAIKKKLYLLKRNFPEKFSLINLLSSLNPSKH